MYTEKFVVMELDYLYMTSLYCQVDGILMM